MANMWQQGDAFEVRESRTFRVTDAEMLDEYLQEAGYYDDGELGGLTPGAVLAAVCAEGAIDFVYGLEPVEGGVKIAVLPPAPTVEEGE